MEKFQHQYCVDALAEALEVSESGFVAHQGKQNGQRWKQDAELRVMIAQSFEQSRNTYGSPRVRRELGQRCGKNRVARLMRESGLRARQKRRFRPRTTESRHDHKIAENWLRNFQQCLRVCGVTPSMSRKGFVATLKTECFADAIPPTKAAAKLMIFDYIETF